MLWTTYKLAGCLFLLIAVVAAALGWLMPVEEPYEATGLITAHFIQIGQMEFQLPNFTYSNAAASFQLYLFSGFMIFLGVCTLAFSFIQSRIELVNALRSHNRSSKMGGDDTD